MDALGWLGDCICAGTCGGGSIAPPPPPTLSGLGRECPSRDHTMELRLRHDDLDVTLSHRDLQRLVAAARRRRERTTPPGVGPFSMPDVQREANHLLGGPLGALVPGADTTPAERISLTRQSQELWALAEGRPDVSPALALAQRRAALPRANNLLSIVLPLQTWGEAGLLENLAAGFQGWDSKTQVVQRLRETIRVASAHVAGRTPQRRAAPTSRMNVWEETGRNVPGEVAARTGELARRASEGLEAASTPSGLGKLLLGLAAGVGAIAVASSYAKGRGMRK